MEPLTWWKGFCCQRGFIKGAAVILSFPTSTAACERNWSSQINSEKHNRLTDIRTNKLVSVNHNLNLLRKIRETRLELDTYEMDEQIDDEVSPKDYTRAMNGKIQNGI